MLTLKQRTDGSYIANAEEALALLVEAWTPMFRCEVDVEGVAFVDRFLQEFENELSQLAGKL